MIFREIKNETGYTYDTEDVFGTVNLRSKNKLTPDLLDEIVVLLLKQNISAETITGSVKHGEEAIEYEFKKAPMFEEVTPEEEESWNDTPTPTNETESESTPASQSKGNILSWFVKFVEAFREAWKNTK